MRRHRRHLAALIGALIGASTNFAVASAQPPSAATAFNRQDWLDDFAQLRSEMQRSYVNLAWMGSPRSGVDVPDLRRRAERALAAAEGDEDARRAIREFVAGFHDGHFSELPYLQAASTPVAPEPAEVVLDPSDPATGCAALGFASTGPVSFSLPFERLPGFRLLSDGLSEPFRVGLITPPSGRKVGIVRIQNFRAAPFPAACTQAWARLRTAGTTITAQAVRDSAESSWFDNLADQLQRLRREGAAAVIVDVGSNSGGNDSGDWVARMFTDRPVVSARLFMVAAPISGTYFDEQLTSLAEGLRTSPPPAAAPALRRAVDFFARQKVALDNPVCDLSWVWNEQRAWRIDGCNRLVDAGYSGGAMAGLPRGAYGGNSAVSARLSWASRIDAHFGAWSGPTYVLINPRSFSSAEMFAAVMQDNHVARLIGERTGGDGCGFMVEGEPLVLRHSRLRFRMPNCMRLRRSGDNEVAGIQPDIPLPAVEGESPRARASRALAIIGGELDAPPR